MSWGNKLVIVFICFAGMMGTLVYKAMQTRFDLVTKDYYKEELRFQEQIDATKNAATISDINIDQNDSEVVITFPKEHAGMAIEGEAWFYCKADVYRDKKIPVSVNNGQLLIKKERTFKGNYELKLRWTANGKSFYATKDITVL